jgi:uncharacterized protein (TIGR03437 family)
VAWLALDPHLSRHLFALWLTPGPTPSIAPLVLYASTNGGATWTQFGNVSGYAVGIVVDPSTNPSTVYYGLQNKSADGGVTWTALAPLPGATASGASAFAVDPSGTIYASGPWPTNGMFVSRDRAQTWTATGSPTAAANCENASFCSAVSSIVPAGSSGVVYSVVTPAIFVPGSQAAVATAGFLSRISADGSTLEYSTYLRGHEVLEAYGAANEPTLMFLQNWIAGLAIDSAGDVIVTGGTRATDFPTLNSLQSANAGLADAFAAVISADGGTLKYSTYLGGSQDDGALAVNLDPQGNIVLAGQTWSSDFPITNGAAVYPGSGGGFVAKLAVPVTPVITAVLNGASFQPGIEAGSWVTIEGTNLANTTRTWKTSDFTGNDLPTSLSGVSVTIDGNPAFVEYISPTQINVQAPSDSATGAVNVLVTNNGLLSAPATAQLQTYAPAFFLNPGTNSTVATVIPGYTPVTSATPARPGDLVVLWGTGFGPTTPATAAGSVVSGAPATASTPVVTVGGMQVQVISSGLTTGTAGLYQITIQLPANVPTGTLAVEASIGGAQTPAGATVVIANP